jgi:hypothetical protein
VQNERRSPPAGAESPDEGTPTGAMQDASTPDDDKLAEGTPDRYPDLMARVLTGLLTLAN